MGFLITISKLKGRASMLCGYTLGWLHSSRPCSRHHSKMASSVSSKGKFMSIQGLQLSFFLTSAFSLCSFLYLILFYFILFYLFYLFYFILFYCGWNGQKNQNRSGRFPLPCVFVAFLYPFGKKCKALLPCSLHSLCFGCHVCHRVIFMWAKQCTKYENADKCKHKVTILCHIFSVLNTSSLVISESH